MANEDNTDDVVVTARHVLVVDDEPRVLSAIQRQLRRCGYRVTGATSATEGLRVLEHRPVDVLISDLCMPGLNGVDFLVEVAGRWPATARIVLTGHPRVHEVRGRIGDRVQRWLTKPWDGDALAAAVADAAAARATGAR